jgi:hypothetical protein
VRRTGRNENKAPDSSSSRNREASLSLIVLAAGYPQTGKADSLHDPEQRHFSAEAIGVERPILVPGNILGLLRKDESVRYVLKDQGIPEEMGDSKFRP